MDNVGAPPTDLMAFQNSISTVRVSWTAPFGRYRVTADPGSVSVDTFSFSSRAITIQQPGVYNISVITLSQHYPGETVGPVEVTVRGKGNSLHQQLCQMVLFVLKEP